MSGRSRPQWPCYALCGGSGHDPRFNGKVKKVLNEKGRRVLIEWSADYLGKKMIGSQSIDLQLLSGIQKIERKVHGYIIYEGKNTHKMTFIGKL